DGIPETNVFGALYEDRSGRIWIGMLDGTLYHCDPREGDRPRFERLAIRESTGLDAPRELFEDSHGELWLSPYVGLARLVAGKLSLLEPSQGLPQLETRCLFQDHRGRLWIGTRFRGASVTDDPAAERPRFRAYTMREGL